MIEISRLLIPIDDLIIELEKTTHPSALYFQEAKAQILATHDEAFKFNFLDALKGIAPMSSYGGFNLCQDAKLSKFLDVVHELLDSFRKS